MIARASVVPVAARETGQRAPVGQTASAPVDAASENKETCHQFIAIHVSDLVQEIACELPVFVHIVSKSLL